MPFRSKRQQRLFFATMPDTAKEWASKTDFSKLPERVRKKKKNSECDDSKKNKVEKILQLATKYHIMISLAQNTEFSDFNVGDYIILKQRPLVLFQIKKINPSGTYKINPYNPVSEEAIGDVWVDNRTQKPIDYKKWMIAFYPKGISEYIDAHGGFENFSRVSGLSVSIEGLKEHAKKVEPPKKTGNAYKG